ncbi:MAG: NAD-dependent epimerase/dehydratase family protein [Gammaproteobacteria bacterium]
MNEGSGKGRIVLLTGATGFVGRHVGAYLQAAGFQVRAAVRAAAALPSAWEQVEIGEIGPETVWDAALDKVDAVVHLASHSPRPGASAAETAAAYRRINVAGSECLARAALEAGARRLVYLSTIKVNGETTPLDVPFTAETPPRPQDVYGETKRQAEERLRAIGAEGGLETVILRSPIVYGPGVRANFLALLRLVERGLPVPLSRVRNRRSMIYVDNLADIILRCLDAPQASGQTYLVSDDMDVSTPELMDRIAAQFGRKLRSWPVPVTVLRGIGHLTGKRAVIDRLTGSLVVDVRKLREQLGWTPPYTLDDGLRETVRWYLAGRKQAA